MCINGWTYILSRINRLSKVFKRFTKKRKLDGIINYRYKYIQRENGHIKCHPDKKIERKSTIEEYLQDLISQFLFTNAAIQQVLSNNKNNYFAPNQEKTRYEKLNFVLKSIVSISNAINIDNEEKLKNNLNLGQLKRNKIFNDLKNRKKIANELKDIKETRKQYSKII